MRNRRRIKNEDAIVVYPACGDRPAATWRPSQALFTRMRIDRVIKNGLTGKNRLPHT